MGVRDTRRAAAVRRMLEGTVATVLGGAILWAATGPLSRSTVQPSTVRPALVTFDNEPLPPPIATPAAATMPPCQIGGVSPPPTAQNLLATASAAGRAIAPLLPATPAASGPVPVSALFLFEDFSHYRDGETANWGPNTCVKTGLDHRKWLASNVDGAHPVGRNVAFPGEFFFECRYSAYVPEATRGLLGWWREPVASRISLLDNRGAKHTIQWAIGCGSDRRGLNPLASLTAVKYFHSIRLPGAAAAEVEASSPTGILRINRCGDVVNVLVNGQLAASGMLPQATQLAGFEIDVVKAKNGALFFTDFKIGR
jgi:hypothetical protein